MTENCPAILQVLPRLESGGVERGTVEITQATVKSGFKSFVASSGGPLVHKITRAGGTHLELPLASKNPFVIYRNATLLYRHIKNHDIKVIHARSRAPAWSAYYAAKWANIPFLTTFHGIYGDESHFKRLYNKVMVKGKLVIAVSQFVQQHIIQNYKIDPSKIRLIPRGVDFSLFDEKLVGPQRVAQLIKEWRLPEESVPIIFCPGRISRIKGQHLLIEALSHIKHLNFICIIAGTDAGHEHYREEVEELTRSHGLEGKVRFAGSTGFMTEAYTLSQLVVVPSIKPESFGRVAIEAQAMGKLVVATDHGGARETIIPNETGYLVPNDQPKIMSEAIAYALSLDAETAKAMGEYAKKYVRENFTSQKMQDKTIAVYHELLGSAQEPATQQAA